MDREHINLSPDADNTLRDCDGHLDPAALGENEERLRLVVAATRDAIWDLEMETGSLKCSDRFVELYGSPAAGQSVWEWWPERVYPDDRERTVASLQAALVGGEPNWSAEYRFMRLDGQWAYIQNRAYIVRAESGKARRVIGAMQDQTDAQLYQAALRESESRYRSLFENSMDAILMVLLDGNILAANPAACALFGMTEDEMRAKGPFGLIDPMDRRIEDYLKERNETGKSKGELRLVRNDGAKFIGDVSAFIVPVEPPKSFVIIRDITAQKQAEEALRQNEERYRGLVEKTNSAIVRWTPDGTITFFNEYAQKFFGYSAEEVVGKPAHIFVPDQDSSGQDLSWLIDDILRNPDRYSSHVNENICRDGRRAWVAWANKPVFDENGKLVEIFSVGTDITHQKHVEDELKELNATLEERVWERTHKLNEMVRQLRSLADQLTRAEDQERQRLAELLHNDIQQLLVASRMRLGLVPAQGRDPQAAEHIGKAEELLDDAITKTRDLSHELRPPVFRKHGIIPALEWLCAQASEKHGLSVKLIADEDVDLAEPIKIFLFRAAQEILFNIVKHAQVKEAEMLFSHIDRLARLMIADHGRGFDPAQIGPASDQIKGFGLFSIQERIALLGGWLDIESAPGQGSRFTLYIPI